MVYTHSLLLDYPSEPSYYIHTHQLGPSSESSCYTSHHDLHAIPINHPLGPTCYNNTLYIRAFILYHLATRQCHGIPIIQCTSTIMLTSTVYGLIKSHFLSSLTVYQLDSIFGKNKSNDCFWLCNMHQKMGEQMYISLII